MNGTGDGFLSFVLVGIPGLEHLYFWISIPFHFLYILTVFANCTLIFIIRSDASLQTPMHAFLAMLAMADLCLSFSTLPTVLGVFWFHSLELPSTACLVQMYLIHSFSVMESSTLLAMAYDRFVAICNPLRYSSIFTNSLITKIGLVTVTRGLVLLLPIPVLLSGSTPCKSMVLSHAFCLHPDVTRLLCSAYKTTNVYSIFAVLSTMGLDALLIILSYVLILKAVCHFGSMTERWKALHTCVCHICVVLLFYMPMISLSIIHRYGAYLPQNIHVPMAYLHFLLPPALNPIIYGIKTRPIHRRIVQKIRRLTTGIEVSTYE
ncbi:olfactory receptor 51G2-like [Spea bombifrons]|uniref:olfactory receptor 51G2-like n=1 Tax=Spea bombifrons TaxID=233779 RepID=UPI00234AB913|nr:olfactory receptor 51G2-like [Spea bombifrons]